MNLGFKGIQRKTGQGRLFSLLNLHWLVLLLLVAVNVSIGARLGMAWHTLHSARPEQIDQQQETFREMELRMRPLRGLPFKVQTARTGAARFDSERLPSAYSTIASSLGDLASASGVRLTRVAYQQSPAIPGLASVQMDASLSGQYAPLMHFINGLERSKTFFLIDDLTLSGEQGGNVNLRLRLTTFLQGSEVQAPPAPAGSATPQGETD